MNYFAALRIRTARRMALERGSDILHALGCTRCGLRIETLCVLTMLGWTEESFTDAYFAWLLKAR
jgi:hypothetical protein